MSKEALISPAMTVAPKKEVSAKEKLHHLKDLSRSEVKKKLRRVEADVSYVDMIKDELEKVVFGQPKACKAIARAIALSETGLNDSKRPLCAVMELGPRGSGKTETGHAVASYLFGDPDSDRLKIIKMEEYSDKHKANRFTGSPQGYVGAEEPSAIPHDWLHAKDSRGKQKYSIIVFDEIEKADDKVKQALLGILDMGEMEARNGSKGFEPLNFRNTIIILTSNIAGREISDIQENKAGTGFQAGSYSCDEAVSERIQRAAAEGLKEQLSPEFIDRLTDIVVFEPLKDRNVYDKILNKFIDQRNKRLEKDRKYDAPYFSITTEFREHILDEVGTKGGRELMRILEKSLFQKATDVFLGMDVRGRPLVADWEDGEVIFYTDEIKEVSAKEVDEVLKKPASTEMIPYRRPGDPDKKWDEPEFDEWDYPVPPIPPIFPEPKE